MSLEEDGVATPATPAEAPKPIGPLNDSGAVGGADDRAGNNGGNWRMDTLQEELKKLPVLKLAGGAFAFIAVASWAFGFSTTGSISIENRCEAPVTIDYLLAADGDEARLRSGLIEPGSTLELEPLSMLAVAHFTRSIEYDKAANESNIEMILSPEGSNCPLVAPTE